MEAERVCAHPYGLNTGMPAALLQQIRQLSGMPEQQDGRNLYLRMTSQSSYPANWVGQTITGERNFHFLEATVSFFYNNLAFTLTNTQDEEFESQIGEISSCSRSNSKEAAESEI